MRSQSASSKRTKSRLLTARGRADGRLSVLELIEKLGPLAIALCSGAWVLVQYFKFAEAQAGLSVEIAKHQVARAPVERTVLEQQAASGSLEATRKGAFQVESSSDLSVEPLAGSAPQRYWIHWSVRVMNGGNRDLEISKHHAELFVGHEVKRGAGRALLEVNHPKVANRDVVSSSLAELSIEWVPGAERQFSPGDLYQIPLGGLDPGDTRYAELSAIVDAKPGTWIFARSEITVLDRSCMQAGARPDAGSSEAGADCLPSDTHWQWDYKPISDADKSTESQLRPK